MIPLRMRHLTEETKDKEAGVQILQMNGEDHHPKVVILAIHQMMTDQDTNAAEMIRRLKKSNGNLRDCRKGNRDMTQNRLLMMNIIPDEV